MGGPTGSRGAWAEARAGSSGVACVGVPGSSGCGLCCAEGRISIVFDVLLFISTFQGEGGIFFEISKVS